MQRNYFEITPEASVASFLSEFSEKNNTNFIILSSQPKSFVDMRTLSLRAHNKDEKLQNLKQVLPKVNSKGEAKLQLINSGAKVVEIQDESNYYDIYDALKEILKSDEKFLSKTLKESSRNEIFALNSSDSIAHARSTFLKKRINLLPVIEGLKIIGEVRPFDLLISGLLTQTKEKKELFKESYTKDLEALPISNILNKKPLSLNSNQTYKDAISLMVEKKIPSVIVTYNEELYSIISYKDIFKEIQKNLNLKEFVIQYSKASELFEDEFDLVQEYVEKAMKKISSISSYDTLNVNFKAHGNVDGTHQKRYSLTLNLSSGNHTLHIDKEMQEGKWNLGLLVLDALQALEKKVKEEKKK